MCYTDKNEHQNSKSNMNKRYLHHIWTRIRPIKTGYLLALFIVSAIICISALRSNNLTMLKLRNQVYTADKSNGNVEGALEQLRSYVGAHMNTSLTTDNDSVYPPIQLKYTYQRLVVAANSQNSSSSSQLYTQAEDYCQSLNSNNYSGRSRVPCVENYVSSHTTTTPSIPSSLYEFDFVSPVWSPDLAGWSLLVTIALLILTVLRFAIGFWFKRYAE
jgi:hypothetical protein